MKAAKWSSVMGLVGGLIFSSLSEAHMTAMGTKPVAPAIGMYDHHHRTMFWSGTQRLDGSKPVLLMLGETPRTTLTTSHIRRETWVHRGDYLLGTKPVIKMLLQQLGRL
jgi:hypothetical protein